MIISRNEDPRISSAIVVDTLKAFFAARQSRPMTVIMDFIERYALRSFIHNLQTLTDVLL
jgi:hypothetical protein